MLIQILVDNPASWILPHAIELKNRIIERFDHTVNIIHTHEEVLRGDILCLLSCEKIFKKLNYNDYNLVVHESALPSGKGWSPLTWQVLEGKSTIPITLFEAEESVDSGRIYAQETIKLDGHELLPELKYEQGKKTIDLILMFIDNFPMEGRKQEGEGTFYRKRTFQDSELDIHKTINDQFDLLRISDNERYPAHFFKNGIKYVLRISKE